MAEKKEEVTPDTYYDSAKRAKNWKRSQGKSEREESTSNNHSSGSLKTADQKRVGHELSSAGCKGRLPKVNLLPEIEDDADEENDEVQGKNPFATLQEEGAKSYGAKKELRGGISPPPTGEPTQKNQKVVQPFDFILVLDFEATCECNDYSFPHEIIEFPIVVIDTAKRRVVAEFRSYVKPKRFGGKLTKFCTELTGITQDLVDAAPPLQEVVQQFTVWFESNVPKNSKVIFATDGPWDLRNFMCMHSVVRDGVEFPKMFYSYLDVRHCFADHMHCKPRGVQAMLAKLSLVFQGRQHCGLDDTKNIARIVLALMKRGYVWSNVVKVQESRIRLEFENESLAEAIAGEPKTRQSAKQATAGGGAIRGRGRGRGRS